jgi:hypothetical protein
MTLTNAIPATLSVPKHHSTSPLIAEHALIDDLQTAAVVADRGRCPAQPGPQSGTG